MKRLIALILLAAGPAAAEELPVRLSDGATWTMTVEHARERESDGVHKATTSTTVTRLVWHDRTLTVHPVSAIARSGTTEGNIPAIGIPIVLSVDEALTPVEIRNETEVRAAVEAIIALVLPDAKQRGDVTNVMPSLVDTTMSAMATANLTRAALGQGTSLDMGKTTAYEDSLPNPLGGPPIVSKASFKLEAYDQQAGRAVVSWRQTLDPDSVRASVTIALTKVAPDKVDEARAAYATMKIEREDACRHEIDIPTGLAVKVVCTTETVMDVAGQAGRNSDRWTITQTLPQTKAAR